MRQWVHLVAYQLGGLLMAFIAGGIAVTPSTAPWYIRGLMVAVALLMAACAVTSAVLHREVTYCRETLKLLHDLGLRS